MYNSIVILVTEQFEEVQLTFRRYKKLKISRNNVFANKNDEIISLKKFI